MKSTNKEKTSFSVKKKRSDNIISRYQKDLLIAEIEYKEYYNRIKMLSRGM